MNDSSSVETRRRELWAYSAAVALCLLILIVVMQLWKADLTVPFAYGGDTMFYQILTKGMLDHGWFGRNPSLGAIGAPSEMDLRDIPTTDNNFYLLLLKLFSFFSGNYALIVNLFFLLTFPLTTVTALFVFRRFGVSRLSAIAGSLLYTFLPFHFSRGENHLFLSAYYFIPLTVMIVLWVCDGTLVARSARWAEVKSTLRERRFLASLVICVLVASTGTYYAFFACFFLLVAAASALVRDRRPASLLVPGIFIAVITAGVIVNLLPSVLYLHRRGDTTIVRRNPADSDVYGFKMAQLLLPISNHRVYRVSQFKGVYNLRPYVNENDDSSLGLVGGLGFLFMLGWFLYRRIDPEPVKFKGPEGALNHLSLLNLSAVLLATIGGFGSLVAFLLSPKIRAYNRISVYIGFFALFAVALLLDEARKRRHSTRLRAAITLSLPLVVALGVFDQTSKNFVPRYDLIKGEYRQDADFARVVESSLPRGAKVFQLPVASFPENPKIEKMADYDLARGYLHSGSLRWSYGAVKGREEDVWQRTVSAKPTADMVESLALSGFGGLYIDRYGFGDNAAKLEGEISDLTSAAKLVSANGRASFFDLTSYEKKLREKYPAPEWEARKEAAIHPLMTLWQNGFSDSEGDGKASWRWCAEEGRAEIVNGTQVAKRVVLESVFAAGREANLWIESPLFSERLKINMAGVPFTKELVVPPGRHVIRFRCDAPRVLAPLDSRVIVFRAQDFRLREIN